MALAVADLIPLAVLALTFYPPFTESLTWHGRARTVALVRAACVAALGALGLLFLWRERLDALVDRLNAHVRLTVAASGAVTTPTVTLALAHMVTAAAFAAALVSVGIAVTSASAFRAFIREGGVVESASALCWFAGAACTVAALLVDRRRFALKLVFYGALCAFCVFAGGEEMNWGQRMLGYQTPTVLESLNKQRQVNLHDIGSISVNETIFFVLTTICCLVVPGLLKRTPAWGTYLRGLNAPIVDPFVGRVYGVGLVAWIIIGLRFGTLGFSPLSLWGYYTQMDDEVWEFFAALGFFALASLDLARRLSDSPAPRVTSMAAPLQDCGSDSPLGNHG